MPDRILIATRKGLFVATRDGKAWVAGEPHFPGQSVNYAMADPRDGTLYAAINHGHFGVKLRRSDDGGANWDEIAAPAFPKTDGEEDAPSVDLIWCLAPGGEGETGVIWAGTIPGGLFRSEDRGETWLLNEPLWAVPEREHWFGGGYDKPGIHSLCVDPRDPKRIVVGVSCGGVWRTADGGENWSLHVKGMRADYMPPEAAEGGPSQDPHFVAQVQGEPDIFWTQHHCGIFRSADALEHWDEITPVKPSAFGFAVAAHPKDGKTAWFVPAVKDEFRYPVDGQLVVTRTRDGGKTFDILSKGLPTEPSYDLIYRHALDIDGDGKCLAMGSTTGGAWVSEDEGESWTELPMRLPPVYSVRFA